MNSKNSIIIAAVFGALGVVLGAFGAHALASSLEAAGRLATFETAVKYQFYHALALFGLGLLQYHVQGKLLKLSAWFFTLGILIFSGSLYAICFSGITAFGVIAPIGGLLLIAGWILLAMGVYKGDQVVKMTL